MAPALTTLAEADGCSQRIFNFRKVKVTQTVISTGTHCAKPKVKSKAKWKG